MPKNVEDGRNKFDRDPFYLYPLKDEMIDSLFIDREKDIKTANGILDSKFKETVEICAVTGGIGVGKSSMLNLIGKLAAGKGFTVECLDGPEAYLSERKTSGPKRLVVLIDDVDKVDDDRAIWFYTRIASDPPPGIMIFFTDTYNRGGAANRLRHFTISQAISLPQRLDMEQLRSFLEGRMIRCLQKGSAFEFPYEEDALELASRRSDGNLRNFLRYSKRAWSDSIGDNRSVIRIDDVISSIIAIDSLILADCDITDMKVLWYTTLGEINKAFLAHQCGINVKTLETRLTGRLQELVHEKKNGKEIQITSVYRELLDGEKILKKIILALGFRMEGITGTKDEGRSSD